MDLVMRAREIFDRVILLVMDNGSKRYMFDISQRLAVARAAVEGLEGVEAQSFEGLLCEYAKEHNAVIVKGARNSIDFEYECSLYEINRELENCETMIFPAKKEYSFVSSTFVRELLHYGRDPAPYVPAAAVAKIEEFIKN
jgi:pantetheine-phosphate adenylyltransferase